METLFSLLMPLVMAGTGLYALGRQVDVFSALTEGALDGLKTLVRIFLSLLMLLPAISMLRVSGLLDALCAFLGPIPEMVGIPAELVPLMFLRPLSGSAALAAATEIMLAYGPDSLIGRTAAVMIGSTETTFYVLTVYFGASGIKKGRRIFPAALFADMVGFFTAACAVRLFWS